MFKTVPGKTGRIHGGGTGLRGRDTEFPAASPHVSDGAQALPLDMNTIRQFSFGQLDRSPIPERPNTSGGPAATSDFPFRRDAWKRETRDDFDFPPPSTYGKQTTFYDFPLPGGLPTPDSSPKEITVPTQTSSVERSPTPESIEIEVERIMEGRGMAIGMAIGSPTQAPAAWQQPQRFGNTHSPSPDPTEASMDRNPMPPKHKSKWKMFGGLFGGGKKQPTVQAQNFYQLQSERTPTEQQPIRGWTTSEQSAERKKPEATRANTAPVRFNMNYGQENPEILIDGNRLEENPQARVLGNRMLDVDIPSVEMERYSVMFGSLLSNPSTASTPSLLARRQATLDRLKVVNEELAQKEHEIEEKERQIKHPRRATSPQPTRSPAFSLFPNTPSRDSRFGRTPSPNGRLIRSNTSPAALSPSRPSFAPGLENEIHANLMEPGPHIPTPGYESYSGSRDRSTSATPKPRKNLDLKSIVKQAQAQAAIDLQTRSFTPDQTQLTRSPETDMYDASPLYTRRSFSESRPIMSKYVPPTSSSSGSATSQSDHSTASSISTTTSAIKPPSRTPSPQAQNTTKTLPIPMSKFTAPPLTHKSRGRSQTTSTGTPSSNLTQQTQISRPRLPEISGPTNLSSTSPSISTTPNSSSPRPAMISKPQKEEEKDDENEARLKTLADVSIARQISVSRQQRQLLIPIRSNLKSKSSTEQTASHDLQTTATSRPTMRARASTVSTSSPSAPTKSYNQNFPSPLHNLPNGGINVSNVTSPLSAVERATREEWEQSNSIAVTSSSASNGRKERLVAGVRPSMPTLVIVGGNGSSAVRGNEREEGYAWEVSANGGGSVRVREKSAKSLGDGIAERRRRARAEKDGRGHEYKKSEKVVVERV